MRRLLERISPVLLVWVVAGGFVVMSSLPATAESATERLDRLHAGRPVAATGSNHASVDDRLQQENARLFAEGYAAGETPVVFVPPPPPVPDEAPPPAPPAPPAPQPVYRAPVAGSGSCSGDVDCFLACTRAHESDSSGGYGAVSPGGTYRGAYQFDQSTFDAAVSGAGYGQYAGVPPDQVPAAVQDAAAAQLYSVSGNRPWNGRC